MNQEGRPEQGTMEHAEGHGQRGHTLDASAMKHLIRYIQNRHESVPTRALGRPWAGSSWATTSSGITYGIGGSYFQRQ